MRRCESHNVPRGDGGIRWHPGTAHPPGRGGNATSSPDEAICCSVIPSPVSRVMQRPHTPPVLVPRVVDRQPPTLHSLLPNNGWAAGSDSTRAAGSQPASARNPTSSIAARRAAGPTNLTPAST